MPPFCVPSIVPANSCQAEPCEQLHFVRVGEIGEQVEVEAAGTDRNLPVDLRVDAAGAQAAEVEIRRRDRVDAARRRIAPQVLRRYGFAGS